MGVPEIMHTNLLYTGFFTSSEHFMVQEMFGVREKSVVIFILTGHVILLSQIDYERVILIPHCGKMYLSRTLSSHQTPT